MEIYKLLDVAVPEQVIEVPKIFVDDIPSRLSVREPQLADQLVEVPPIVPHVVPQSFFAAADGYVWRQLSGPTGAYWWMGGLLPHPVGPHRGIPPGQGGIQILAAGTLADVAVVDVPVNMQHKFQQSLVLLSVHQQVVLPVAAQRQVCTALLC